MRLVLLGAPGAGKGTQAKKIVQRFKISHISTGNILRNEIKNDTELGRKAGNFVKEGKLVPDELIIEIIKKADTFGITVRDYSIDFQKIINRVN